MWPKRRQTIEEDCPYKTKMCKLSTKLSPFSRSCDMYKRESKILEMKYKWNVTCFETRRILESYIRENIYAFVARRVNPIRNGNQHDNYRALVEKLIHLEPNDWPKFQKQLKNLHTAEIHHTEKETKLKELISKKNHPMK